MAGRIGTATRAVGRVLGRILAYLLLWLGLTCLIAALGIRHYWGPITFDQLRTNLFSVQTDGGGGAIVWKGILGVGVLPVVVTLAVAGIIAWRRRVVRRRMADGAPRPPRSWRWPRNILATLAVLALGIGGTSAFASTVGIRDYLRAASSPYTLDDYYAAPTVTSDAGKRNLVVIYLESGEQTLADDQLFEKDAFQGLEEATSEAEGWQSIPDYRQYDGGGWTMAGIVSTQCGVPLKGGSGSSSIADSAEKDENAAYLGGLTCMGDVLKEHGYRNVFLGGANGDFAAKSKFLGGHGYDEQKDLHDWRAAGEPEENFRSDWGLSDQRLMAHAKDEIDQLHAEAQRTGQPFNLSMLTLDTHEPVHVFDYCNVDTQSEVTSVYACSMNQVADYVQYMKQKGYLEDTAVVIMGDHLKHMSAGDAFHAELDDNPNRTIFNRIWVPEADRKKGALRSGADQLNMYPTMLEAAGLELKDHEAGLGVSAFTEKIPEGSAQSLSPEDYRLLLEARSQEFYDRAWQGAGRN